MKRELQIKRLGHEGKQKLANRAEGNLAGEFLAAEREAEQEQAKPAGRNQEGSGA